MLEMHYPRLKILKEEYLATTCKCKVHVNPCVLLKYGFYYSQSTKKEITIIATVIGKIIKARLLTIKVLINDITL